MDEEDVPRVSSDPTLASSIQNRQPGSRRSLMLAFENLGREIEGPKTDVPSRRKERSLSFYLEDPRSKSVGLTRSTSQLPYLVRNPLHPHNAPPPTAPLPSSPAMEFGSRRSANDSRQRLVARQPRHLGPSPRGAGLLAPSPRPRSGSHTSSEGSGSPSPTPSRPASPVPSLSPMYISSPRPAQEAATSRPVPPIFSPSLFSDVTMDGMSDAYVTSDSPSPVLSLDRSLSAEGSQLMEPLALSRSVSAEPVLAAEPPLSLSGTAVELRRKREISFGHARLSMSTSNLPDVRFDEEHYSSVLPRVKNSTHPDVWHVSPSTVRRDTEFLILTQADIIDCRFPFEYKGGHVRGAINLSNKDLVQDFFMSLEKKNTVIVFYCEFSSQRGPGSYRHLRASDRKINKDRYPSVWYPQTYVLEGGYKAFFEAHKESCEPRDYIPMLSDDHKEELRQCQMQSTRMRSKSFSCLELRPVPPVCPAPLAPSPSSFELLHRSVSLQK